MGFIYYWIPLTNYIDFNESFRKLTERSRTKNISDGVEEEPNNLHIHLKENKNIDISLNDENKIYELKYVNSNNYGLLVYSHDISDEHILRIIHIQVYHEIKEFFHKHECHNGEEDALLKAYKCSHNDKIEDSLMYYLNLYKGKFNTYYETLREIGSPELLYKEYLGTNLTIPNAIDEIAKKQKMILNIKIEMNYFHFLLSNITNPISKKSYLREFKNFASQFDNLYREYEILDNKYDTLYTSLINKKQNNLAIYGLILALVGLGLGFWGINIGKAGLTEEYFNIKYQLLNKKEKECIFKTQSIDNYMLSLEIKNWQALQFLQNNCNK